MARFRKKRKTDVYRTDFSRISVYPSYRVTQESRPKKITQGDIIKIRISGLDDDGKPTGMFKDYIVIVNGDGFEPGEEIKVKIVEIRGRIVISEPIKDI